jgi:hypothetical protein
MMAMINDMFDEIIATLNIKELRMSNLNIMMSDDEVDEVYTVKTVRYRNDLFHLLFLEEEEEIILKSNGTYISGIDYIFDEIINRISNYIIWTIDIELYGIEHQIEKYKKEIKIKSILYTKFPMDIVRLISI